MLVWPQAENGSKNVFKKGERHVKLIQWCSKEEEKKKQSGRTANVRQTSPEWLCSRTPEQTLHYMIPVHSIDKLKLFPPCRLWQAQATFSSNSTLSILFFLSCLRGSSAPISLHLLPSSHFLSSVQTLRVISQAFCCLDF